MIRNLASSTVLMATVLLPASVLAHAPSVIDTTTATPVDAIVLEDPTLSRAIGSSIDRAGEIDWYRLQLRSGEPLVVGMTAPDAIGTLAATFTVLGPGLPAAADVGPEALALAEAVGVEGAIVFSPAVEPRREVHGGLGFIQYGNLQFEAPVEGSYWLAVQAVDPLATGKYVLTPGQREEFGPEAIKGMAELVEFFMAPWPPEGVDE